jgi:predicted metal-dependent HD superfamily phosphohydrolase
MKERIHSLTKEQATEHLVTFGLRAMQSKYGSERTNAGVEFLTYHNEVHAREVLEAATVLGSLARDRGKITSEDLLLLRIAASFHDTEQLRGSRINEDVSADNAALAMKAIGGFSRVEIRKVRRLIGATKVHMENGTIAQEPTADYLTQVMCDADLSLLGDDSIRYWRRSADLFIEMKRKEGVAKDDLKEFLERQRLLLTVHTFYTPEGSERFPNQEINLQDTEEMLKDPDRFSGLFDRISRKANNNSHSRHYYNHISRPSITPV